MNCDLIGGIMLVQIHGCTMSLVQWYILKKIKDSAGTVPVKSTLLVYQAAISYFLTAFLGLLYKNTLYVSKMVVFSRPILQTHSNSYNTEILFCVFRNDHIKHVFNLHILKVTLICKYRFNISTKIYEVVMK